MKQEINEISTNGRKKRNWVRLLLTHAFWAGLWALAIVLAAILPHVISVQSDPFKAKSAVAGIWVPSAFAIIFGALVGLLGGLFTRLVAALVWRSEAIHPRAFLAIPAASFIYTLASGVLAVGPFLSLYPLSYSLISFAGALGAGVLTLLLIRPRDGGIVFVALAGAAREN